MNFKIIKILGGLLLVSGCNVGVSGTVSTTPTTAASVLATPSGAPTTTTATTPVVTAAPRPTPGVAVTSMPTATKATSTPTVIQSGAPTTNDLSNGELFRPDLTAAKWQKFNKGTGVIKNYYSALNAYEVARRQSDGALIVQVGNVSVDVYHDPKKMTSSTGVFNEQNVTGIFVVKSDTSVEFVDFVYGGPTGYELEHWKHYNKREIAVKVNGEGNHNSTGIDFTFHTVEGEAIFASDDSGLTFSVASLQEVIGPLAKEEVRPFAYERAAKGPKAAVFINHGKLFTSKISDPAHEVRQFKGALPGEFAKDYYPSYVQSAKDTETGKWWIYLGYYFTKGAELWRISEDDLLAGS